MTRRAAIALGGTAIAATAFALSRSTENEITPAERDAMGRVATSFMDRYEVPGLSVAIARHGRLLYQGPFGVSNRETREPQCAG
jgi:CubicO group peptidase (beta-lactamase class C family)